jgi:hypothetical protein
VFFDGHIDAAEMQVTLRERDLDTSVLQCFGDGYRDLTLQLKPCILPSRPETQFKPKSTVAKTQEECCGFSLKHNSGMCFGYFDEKLENSLRVRSVRYA